MEVVFIQTDKIFDDIRHTAVRHDLTSVTRLHFENSSETLSYFI